MFIDQKPCYKKCHQTRAEAKRVLQKMNRKNRTHNVGDVYYCEKCDHYHTTSWPKGRSRDVKKRKQ